MGSADFDNSIELSSLPVESAMEPGQRRQELTMDRFRGSNVNGCGDDVVAGLAEVDVIVWMDELAARTPPSNSVARLEMTSLVFMFVEVPEPV